MKKVFSPEETAALVGMSTEELTDFMKNIGFLDENGNPTEKALKEGFIVPSKETKKESDPFEELKGLTKVQADKVFKEAMKMSNEARFLLLEGIKAAMFFVDKESIARATYDTSKYNLAIFTNLGMFSLFMEKLMANTVPPEDMFCVHEDDTEEIMQERLQKSLN